MYAQAMNVGKYEFYGLTTVSDNFSNLLTQVFPTIDKEGKSQDFLHIFEF